MILQGNFHHLQGGKVNYMW